MRFTGFLLLIALIMAGDASAQPRSRSLALVIGNADYDQSGVIDTSEAATNAAFANGLAPDLANPIRDATLIRDALKAAGYQVTFAVDLDRASMLHVIENFAAAASRAPRNAKVVVYYAGHAYLAGLSVFATDRALYLLPVGARVTSRDALATTPASAMGVTLDILADPAPRRVYPGFNLVLVDACRDNPWFTDADLAAAGGPGSTSISRAQAAIRASKHVMPFNFDTPRTVFTFSTRPGTSALDAAQSGDGANSPFALALSRRLTQPDISVSMMLGRVREETTATTSGAQTPVTVGYGVGDTCIVACAPQRSEIRTAARK